MKKKILATFLAVVMTVSMLSGCGNSNEPVTEKEESQESQEEQEVQAEEPANALESGEPIEISIYTNYSDDEGKTCYDYAAAALAEKYPNVTLNKIDLVQDDSATLKTLAATGQLPDIYQAATDTISTFIESDQIMVLNDIAAETGYVDKLYPSCRELAFSEDGNMYIFPISGQSYLLWFYNKAIFDKYGLEVPKTYEDLEEVIKVLKENDIVPMALFAQEGWNTVAMYDTIATRYNPDGINALDSKEAKITDEGYVTAAQTLEKFVQLGMFQDGCVTTNYDNASAMFLNGQAAMFINGYWYITDATNSLGDDVDWMYYPTTSEENYETEKNAFSGGASAAGFAVNPDGEYAEEAAYIAEFMSEKYSEAKMLKRQDPLVPLDTGIDIESELVPMMRKLSNAIPEITSTTNYAWGLSNAVFSDGLMVSTQGLVSGEYTSEDFIDDMTSVMEEME